MIKNDSKIEDAPKIREEQMKKRVPLGTRNILTAPKKPGFVRRFVNDRGDRIQQFINAGYSIVSEDIEVGDPKIGKPKQIGSIVSSQRDGQRKVLMEIPEEFYKEDYKRAQNKINIVENELKRNITNPGADGLHGRVEIS